MVRPLILATMPRWVTSRTKSWQLQRESGCPVSLGNSQAMALTCMMSSGGKTGRAPGTRQILQTCQSFLKEALAPFTDDLSGQRHVRADLVIVESLGGQQDNFGAGYMIIR